MPRTQEPAARESVSLESLEGRTLLAAPYDFAAVGIRFDGGPSVFLTEGTIDAASNITGTTTVASIFGVTGTTSTDWTRYNRAPRGTFSLTTRDGFTPYTSQTGTQFIADDRWSLGSFVGRGEGGAVRDMATLAERYMPISLPDEVPGWELQMARIMPGPADGPVLAYLPVIVSPQFDLSGNLSAFEFTYVLGEDIFQTALHQISVIDGGRLTLDDGQVLFLTGPNEALLLADFDPADGFMGVAVGRAANPDLEPLNRVYRGAVVATGQESFQFFGGLPGELRPDGTAVLNFVIRFSRPLDEQAGQLRRFELFRQDQWDSGLREPVTTGRWSFGPLGAGPFDSREHELDSNGRFVVLAKPDRDFFVIDRLFTIGGVNEPLFGSAATQDLITGSPVEFLTDVTPGGRPTVYMDVRSEDLFVQSLYRFDLVENVGGENVASDLTHWQTTSGDHYIAGLPASGEVQVWRYDQFGWAYGNLTREIAGARPIIGQMAAARETSGLGLQDLGGFDSNGQVVVYRQMSEEQSIGAWEFVNSSTGGLDGLGALPALSTPLLAWNASWGAIHFAALDTQGQIAVIWWAPGLARWRVDMLSQQAGTPALVGTISVLRTDWDSFQITGTSNTGHVIVTWWAPGQDLWQSSDLTADFGGPTLGGATITSHYNSLVQTMNIIGHDSSGNLRIYWWAPWAGWNVGVLTTGPESVPMAPWRMVSATWVVGSIPPFLTPFTQSVLGHNEAGELVRLVWRSYTTDAWVLENVTGQALPYFT